jgi:UDP-3-O-[3-hydroxymyristoyl] N-acetylglucosamine deacetylase/3-hydroxyacyl-[acyl-carrier-protein] dehydratase
MTEAARQRTIARPVSFCGKGLHTGAESIITFCPAPHNTGIRFKRTDLPGCPEIPATIDHVVPTEIYRRTTIGNAHGVRIHTVEHLLATFLGLGIDNVLVEINSSEPPFGDGSALPFVETLLQVGIVEQPAARRYYVVDKPMVYSENGIEITALPSEQLIISFFVEFANPLIGIQTANFIVEPETFHHQIAPARTFCFLHEVEELQRKGLIRGGSLKSAVVIGETTILNEHLRFQDEIVRHKVVDILGDLYLLGCPIKGHILASKSGHAANINFVKFLRKETTGIMSPTNRPSVFDITKILQCLPHRFPFLLVDRIVEMEEGKRIVGHFPQRPIMPGVLVIEAMAQVGAVMVLSTAENRGKLAYLVGVDKAKFRKPVEPGDQLRIEIEILSQRKSAGKVDGKAFVGETLVAEAEIMFALGK